MLRLFAVGVAVLASLPLFFTLYGGLTVDPELWVKLYQTRLSVLLPNTLKLLLSVGCLVLLIGVSSAWLVSRYNFPGRRLWEWLLVLPFAAPGYILAYAYASIMAPGGPAQELWKSLFEDLPMPSLYSFWGVSLVLSLVNYPYVYLLARSSFLSQNEQYQEISKVLGASRLKRFFRVSLPLAYPGIAAGLSLALMEVLADFGTVSLLRYPTFTEAIYRQMTGRSDPYGAAALASLLATFAFLLLSTERYFRGKRSFEQTKSFKPPKARELSLLGSLAVNIYLFLLLSLAFFIPISMLLKMALTGASQGALDPRFFKYAFNSLLVSFLGASFATLLALPIAYLHARRSDFLNRALFYISSLGYSLPGPVVGVGLLLTATAIFDWLYGSLTLLVSAYVVRFMSVSLQSQDSSLSMVSRSKEEVARTLGASTWRTFYRVLLPLIKGGLFSGWLIVFVDCMKELPATLLLRPLAFDTLAVRVWIDAAESLWEAAAVPALMIVAVGIIPLIIVIGKMGYKDG
ncbi:MAG: iron ABC transporter permease [Acidobacteria bacterium]|jgi:iron(III) transport system permease protein|nr:MAG: iron ABC transporter permease [Acidobacteriota bacterium]